MSEPNATGVLSSTKLPTLGVSLQGTTLGALVVIFLQVKSYFDEQDRQTEANRVEIDRKITGVDEKVGELTTEMARLNKIGDGVENLRGEVGDLRIAIAALEKRLALAEACAKDRRRCQP